MFTKQEISNFSKLPTPFYYYNIDLLKQTLAKATEEADKRNYILHYALKANSNPKILSVIQSAGIGADCVSGNEILRAIECGFKPETIAFAGVGKSDKEINIGLNNNIFCFNCESLQEIEVINDLAKSKNIIAPIAIRINPNVDARSHKYITTGLEENKFGINSWEFEKVVESLLQLKNVNLISIHLHIGSQITDMEVFQNLCLKANEFNKFFSNHFNDLKHINVGGGLGVDYHNPDVMPDFASYFSIFEKFIELFPGQKLHFELGRALVAQMGSLISKTLFVKKGRKTNFVILDAGMNDLIRPALYQAYQKIENINSDKAEIPYDVVGPICESSDCFGKAVLLPETERGDLIAIRSAGAYGEVMSNRYNLRNLPNVFCSDEINLSKN